MGLYLLIFSALLPHLPALEKYLGFHSSSQNSLQFHTSVPSSQRTRVLSPKLCKHKQRLQRRSGSNHPPAPSHAAPSSPERWDGVTPGCRALGRPGTMPGAAVPGRLRSPGGSARRRGAPRSSAALLCPPATRRRQRDGEPGAAGAFGGHGRGCQARYQSPGPAFLELHEKEMGKELPPVGRMMQR